MDTKTLNRIREHEIAKEHIGRNEYLHALKVLQSAGTDYGFNVQLTFDIADCSRKVSDFESYFGAIAKICSAEKTELRNSKSQIMADYALAKDKMHNLEVAEAIELLQRIVWLPGISADFRTKMVVDYLLLTALFTEQKTVQWDMVELFLEKADSSAELQLAVALSKNDFSQLPVSDEIDCVVLERLAHAEHVLFDTKNILKAYEGYIKGSDLQYLNAAISTEESSENLTTGLASYSRFDFVLRQLFQVDMTKIDLQNVIAETQSLQPQSQKLWRKLTTIRNNNIVKIVVDLERLEVRSNLGELDLNRKRIHLQFFNEFANNGYASLEDLSHEVWNQRFDDKVYNRIRIFLQRINRELHPITGKPRIFQLETPYVRLVDDVQIFVVSGNDGEI